MDMLKRSLDLKDDAGTTFISDMQKVSHISVFWISLSHINSDFNFILPYVSFMAGTVKCCVECIARSTSQVFWQIGLKNGGVMK